MKKDPDVSQPGSAVFPFTDARVSVRGRRAMITAVEEPLGSENDARSSNGREPAVSTSTQERAVRLKEESGQNPRYRVIVYVERRRPVNAEPYLQGVSSATLAHVRRSLSGSLIAVLIKRRGHSDKKVHEVACPQWFYRRGYGRHHPCASRHQSQCPQNPLPPPQHQGALFQSSIPTPRIVPSGEA